MVTWPPKFLGVKC